MKEYKEFKLKNKTVVITGGNGFLGKEISKAFLAAGAKVAVIDIFKEDKRGTKIKDLKKFNCDISDEYSVKKCTDEILKEFKRIDILINNAATKTDSISNFFKSFENYNFETWKSVMDVNINGMFLTSKYFGKEIKKNNRGGSILQISSIYGLLAPDSNIYEGSKYLDQKINSPAVYSASKAAVIGFTKWLAAYWAKKKIKVNCIVPGGIESGQNNIFKKKYSDKVPLGRMSRPDDLIPMVLFLCSDLSQYMTGQTVVIDGGYSIL